MGKLIPLGLELHPLIVQYPGWGVAHLAMMRTNGQQPDPFCPICQKMVKQMDDQYKAAMERAHG